ncbi:MAG: DUF4113 domain-containing protein [Burkholderiaceae bacterium]|jgi:DNA polymerase V|nr:DUF4113 domain-containing protein [Burkholderiaceae bacterium]
MQHWPWYLLIDESFVDISGIRGDLTDRSRRLRQRVLDWTGLPTCVGIGPTKTLAKLANHIAKTAERKPGSYPAEFSQVCNLAAMEREALQQVLAATEVREVWGVGPRIGQQLEAEGIKTVLDLTQLDLATVRRRWSVVLERTVRELQGTPCVDLEEAPPAKKEIACTRSFGRAVMDLGELEEAVTTFASRAAEKLRRQGSHAGQVLTFVRTSPFRPDKQYSRSIIVPLLRPTADTAALVEGALMGLRTIYRSGYKFAKAGVMLVDLSDACVEQGELDFEEGHGEGRCRLMTAMDALNRRYGRGTVIIGSAGTGEMPRNWAMRQERRTPRYTTRIGEIPVGKA